MFMFFKNVWMFQPKHLDVFPPMKKHPKNLCPAFGVLFIYHNTTFFDTESVPLRPSTM